MGNRFRAAHRPLCADADLMLYRVVTAFIAFLLLGIRLAGFRASRDQCGNLRWLHGKTPVARGSRILVKHHASRPS